MDSLRLSEACCAFLRGGKMSDLIFVALGGALFAAFDLYGRGLKAL